jgi:RecA-family ATPase
VGKDISDVIREHGPEAGRQALRNAKPFVLEPSPIIPAPLGQSAPLPDGPAKAAQGAKYKLSGRTILDFLDLEIDPQTNLLGDRWLTKGSGAFVIAPSGHGKSSTANQMTVSFAVGRVAFGIKPARPLRILVLQSEDDDAETKKFVQMIHKMNLTEEERKLLIENTRFEYRNDLTGSEFIAALNDFLTEWPADLVLINPLTGFFLADMKDDEKVAVFLRAQLNHVLVTHQCAALLIHHTPKTNFTRLAEMQWYDWMYAMAGCAALTNWARAVMVIAPSKVPGTYRFIAAKRFDEIQWTDREYWFSHFRETVCVDGKEVTVIQWVPASDDQIGEAQPELKGQKASVDAESVHRKMSLVQEYTRETFQEWAGKEFKIGVNPAWGILKALRDEGRVEVIEEKRSGTNSLKRYRKVTNLGQGKGNA